MLFSKSQICRAIESGDISIQPFEPRLLRSGSYCLRLSNAWARWLELEAPVKLWSPDATERHLCPPEQGQVLTLSRGDFLLSSSLERISLSPKIGALLAPLSHVARFGLGLTSGSFLVSPGFGSGVATALTFELSSMNPSPLELTPGMPICHLCFFEISGAGLARSVSVYEGEPAPCRPMFFESMADILGSLPSSAQQEK